MKKVGNEFECKEAMEKYDMSFDELSGLLAEFKKYDPKGTGSISRQNLAAVLSGTSLAQGESFDSDDFFNFLDTDGSGAISFAEFVQSVALLSGKCSVESRLKLAFLAHDTNGTGRVRRSVLVKAINECFDDDVGAEHLSPGKATDTSRRKSVAVRLLDGAGAVDAEDTDIATKAEEGFTFKEFCELVDKNPELLDVSMRHLRERLGMSYLKDKE